MSDDFDRHIGESLDKAFDQMGLNWDHSWHPARMAKRRLWQRWSVGLGGLAASLGLVMLPLTAITSQGQTSVGQQNLAAPQLNMALRKSLTALGDSRAQVDGMAPVYGSYPLAVPTGQNYVLSGSFDWHGIHATSVALQINNSQNVTGGLLFDHGQPVYGFTGSSVSSGNAIPSSKVSRSLTGTWLQGGSTGLSTFSAAANHVYLTHNNQWADLVGGVKTYWATSPGKPNSTVTDRVAALPEHPNHALLVEENSTGVSTGYVTSNGGRSWTSWAMGSASVSNLIAIGSRYWAIVNGTVASSVNGKTFTPMLPLNTNRWQVATYAVNPSNPNMLVASLIPMAGDGIGPVLETKNGGKTWAALPNFPPFGSAPSSMSMTANGRIAALVNLSSPILLTYQPQNNHWHVLPVPVSHNAVMGVGQLAEDPMGNLIYGAPGGSIYRWSSGHKAWDVINPPAGAQLNTSPASPLQAIGIRQILAGYNTGWYIYYMPKTTHSRP